MPDCTGLITGNFETDCDNLPLGGIETTMVLINKDDVDLSATTFHATNTALMTNLQLKASKIGYVVEGIKQSNSKNYALVIKENSFDKYTHGVKGTIFSPSAATKNLINKLNGGTFIAVIQQKWKGVLNAEAFEVLGFGQGLRLSVLTNDSNENDNAILFEMQSEDGFEESKVPFTLLETDYSTTLTAFNNAFVQGA
jgi:hypothetical protein